MSALVNLVRRHTNAFASKNARSLKARSSYPTVSVVRLGGGPLRRLAWMLGLDHRGR
jgi:hypothetical protein